MSPEGRSSPSVAWLARPSTATLVASVVVCLTISAELASTSEASLEVIYVFAVAYVAWSAPRFAHHGPFAVAAALAHASAETLRPGPEAFAAAWNVGAHVVLFVGAGLLVARARRSMLMLAEIAGTDDLTGAASRRHFIVTLRRELSRAHESGRPHGVALVDLDRFREVNNRFGHDRGDAVLRRVAAAMIAAVAGCGVLGRIGGDEFGVLLLCDDEQALAVAGRLRAAVLDVARAEGLDGVLGVSIGIATCHAAGAPVPHRILKRADELLYAAKSLGDSAVAFEAFDGKASEEEGEEEDRARESERPHLAETVAAAWQ